MPGWIKLHRDIQNHWLYPSDRPFTEYEAWQDLLLSVNHKERKVKVKNRLLECGRGESLRSIKNWAQRWRWSRSKVYRFFELLNKDNMIETVSETVTTRLTICNYSTYQNNISKNETQMKQPRNDPETTPDTNKNDKNVKNDKNEGASPKYEIPNKGDVSKYFTAKKGDMIDSDIPLEAEKFINHYEERGWKTNSGKRIKSWKRQAATWYNNYLEYNRDRIKKSQEKNTNPPMQFAQ